MHFNFNTIMKNVLENRPTLPQKVLSVYLR